jgi:hypothetical protein
VSVEHHPGRRRIVQRMKSGGLPHLAAGGERPSMLQRRCDIFTEVGFHQEGLCGPYNSTSSYLSPSLKLFRN